MSDFITIEVAYANPKKQIIISFQAPKNISVKEAITLSGIEKKFNEIDLSKNQLGIFGKITSLDAKLKHKDRIEIYRLLIADPKEIRRKKATLSKKLKRS